MIQPRTNQADFNTTDPTKADFLWDCLNSRYGLQVAIGLLLVAESYGLARTGCTIKDVRMGC